MLLPGGIRYVSVKPGTGYGDAASQYIAGLRTRVPVTWTVPEESDDDPGLGPHVDIRDIRLPYDTVIFHDRPSRFGPWVGDEHARVVVAYVAWEADRAPSSWREVLDRVDLVLVPSEFNRTAVKATGTSTPVAVLPHIARRVTPRSGGAFEPISRDDFVFYTMGVWHNRKALAETVRAFLDTFTAEDAVGLVVKTSQLDYEAVASIQPGATHEGRHAGYAWWSMAHIVREYPRPAKVLLFAGDESTDVIDQIHTRGNCFLSLSRGEGWGLASFDAASFGNPSIVTGWGGHLDYLGSDYPYLVDYELVQTSSDNPDAFGFPQSDDAHWARANRAHASALMRYVYEHRDESAAVGAQLRGAVNDKFAPVVVTSRFLTLLAEAHDSVRL